MSEENGGNRMTTQQERAAEFYRKFPEIGTIPIALEKAIMRLMLAFSASESERADRAEDKLAANLCPACEAAKIHGLPTRQMLAERADEAERQLKLIEVEHRELVDAGQKAFAEILRLRSELSEAERKLDELKSSLEDERIRRHN
jgi:hypothetical protein